MDLQFVVSFEVSDYEGGSIDIESEIVPTLDEVVTISTFMDKYFKQDTEVALLIAYLDGNYNNTIRVPLNHLEDGALTMPNVIAAVREHRAYMEQVMLRQQNDIMWSEFAKRMREVDDRRKLGAVDYWLAIHAPEDKE